MQGNYKLTLPMPNPSDAPTDSSTGRSEHTHPEDDCWGKACGEYDK
jgi:hypothetical protein